MQCSDLQLLMADPYGVEVVLDYCLEHNFVIPADATYPKYLVGSSRSGSRSFFQSFRLMERRMLSSSGFRSFSSYSSSFSTFSVSNDRVWSMRKWGEHR